MTKTAVQAPRRERLLEAAAGLFAERGFHAVGIDDIGTAAGITGPGVYRHFPSKCALLETLCDRALTRMLAGAREIPAAHPGDPAAALEELVDLHVGFAVGERPLLAVWLREQRALSDGARHSLRRRQRAYEHLWREVLGALRGDLTAPEVALAVATTLGMLNTSALVDTGLGADELARVLRRMALGALLAQGDGPGPPRGLD